MNGGVSTVSIPKSGLTCAYTRHSAMTAHFAYGVSSVRFPKSGSTEAYTAQYHGATHL